MSPSSVGPTLTLLESLAQGGAHFFALMPHPHTSEGVATYIDLADLSMVKAFVASPFTRLYRYHHKRDIFPILVLSSYRISTGVIETLTMRWCVRMGKRAWALGKERDEGVLVTFLLIPFLLPASADGTGGARYPQRERSESVLCGGGTRALRTILSTPPFQRILDALPLRPCT
ncbi:hypothetical protein K438DRAFT_1995681 [Mycena galopus ATCC 62051]|nr:hypothetical protein K438DRAFT_1995681 [Mycena galopus ATCC 62051]